jgi:hypothetical protein
MRSEYDPSATVPHFIDHLTRKLGLGADEVLRLGGEWLLSTEAGQALRVILRDDDSSAGEAA